MGYNKFISSFYLPLVINGAGRGQPGPARSGTGPGSGSEIPTPATGQPGPTPDWNMINSGYRSFLSREIFYGDFACNYGMLRVGNVTM